MPRGDGTGPRGFGPNTGRGFGPCGGRRNYSMRFGPRRGYGYRRYDYQDLSDKEFLLQRKSMLEKEIDNINKLLDDIK